MDQMRPQGAPHAHLISPVSDRPGHDRRYAIDPTLIRMSRGGSPATFEQGLESTVRWFLDNLGLQSTAPSQQTTKILTTNAKAYHISPISSRK